jgi:hypothetical protein
VPDEDGFPQAEIPQNFKNRVPLGRNGQVWSPLFRLPMTEQVQSKDVTFAHESGLYGIERMMVGGEIVEEHDRFSGTDAAVMYDATRGRQ